MLPVDACMPIFSPGDTIFQQLLKASHQARARARRKEEEEESSSPFPTVCLSVCLSIWASGLVPRAFVDISLSFLSQLGSCLSFCLLALPSCDSELISRERFQSILPLLLPPLTRSLKYRKTNKTKEEKREEKTEEGEGDAQCLLSLSSSLFLFFFSSSLAQSCLLK